MIALIALLGAFFLSTLFVGCLPSPTPSPAPTATPVAEEEPLYLAIIWHHHQPLYYKDPETATYTRPWVRVHATRDYYDMVALLERYPKLDLTYNLTPVLIRQLDDFAAGAKHIYWTNMIGRFPRYKELLNKRGGSSDEEIEAALKAFSEQDFRNLEVWFNLAWFDRDFLTEEPLESLVEKGRDFSEADEKIIFHKVLEVIKAVIPKHKELRDKGQIEVITTPYAHPIVPLIYNSDLAAIGDPGGELPKRFFYPQDAIAHLAKSMEIYETHYGRKPRGLWPAEGAVAQDIVSLVAEASDCFWWYGADQDEDKHDSSFREPAKPLPIDSKTSHLHV